MKKGIKILLMSLFLIPIGVNAATVDVSLSCPDSANADSEVTCTIKATPNGSDLKGLEAKFDITGGTYVNFSLDSGWTKYSSSAVGFSIAKNDTTTTTVSSVGTLKVKMPTSGNAVVKLVDVVGTNSNYDTLKSSGASKTIRVKSNVNTLESLSISGTKIVFNKVITTYNVTVDAPSTTISASKTDAYSTVNGLGNKNLNYGNNTFYVDVLAENGSKKTYTININRPDNRSSNNNLSSLKISEGKINFNKDTTNYKVEVNSDITKISIEAALEDSKATFRSGYGSRTVNLNYGNNTIQIKVLSEKQTEKVYTINVIRKDERNSNNNLSNISLSNGVLNFNKEITEYQVSVENQVEEITVSAQPEDSKAKVEIFGAGKIQLGSNEIKIKVTAENGNTKEYRIIVIKKEKNQILDNNNYLKELDIIGYEIDFSKEKTEYVLTIKDETELQITFLPESEKAMATMTGNEELNNDSIIKISVYAENGSVKYYNIYIDKEENKKNDFLLPISIGVFAVGFITFVGSLYYFKHNK